MGENLKVWNEVAETDPFYTKEVGFGAFKFTSINAQYQLKNATDQYGPYGEGWGIREIEYTFLDMPLGQKMALAEAIFFAGKSTFPISSAIMIASLDKYEKMRVDDEWAKKIETDITTKALSKLGFNADVFLGRYDDNKYVNSMKKKFGEVPKKYISEKIYNEFMPKIVDADAKTVKAMSKWMEDFNDNEFKSRVKLLIDTRKKQL